MVLLIRPATEPHEHQRRGEKSCFYVPFAFSLSPPSAAAADRSRDAGEAGELAPPPIEEEN